MIRDLIAALVLLYFRAKVFAYETLRTYYALKYGWLVIAPCMVCGRRFLFEAGPPGAVKICNNCDNEL